MAPSPDSDAEAVQIATTLHSALQTARGSTVFESGNRVSMFLMTVSSSLIALAFIGQATELDDSFFLVTYLLLGALILVGLLTFVRLVQSGVEDFIYGMGIGRLLHFYVERRPELRPYLVQQPSDDPESIFQQYGGPRPLQILFSSASLVAFITSLLAGVLTGLLFMRVAAGEAGEAGMAGGAAVLIIAATMIRSQAALWKRTAQRVPARFPKP